MSSDAYFEVLLIILRIHRGITEETPTAMISGLSLFWSLNDSFLSFEKLLSYAHMS